MTEASRKSRQEKGKSCFQVCRSLRCKTGASFLSQDDFMITDHIYYNRLAVKFLLKNRA